MAGEAFDPDAYLAEGEQPFDPDAYLAETPELEPAPIAPSVTGFTAEDVSQEVRTANVSPFKQKVGLSDPWEAGAQRYAQFRAEQEDLVRQGFKAGAEPGVAPELLDARVSTFFRIPKELVKANREAWLDQYAKASADPRKWIDENPAAARLVLDHPERAEEVVSDKELNLALKAWNSVADWTIDAVDRVHQAMGTPPKWLQAPPGKGGAFSREAIAAQQTGREQRDAPKQVTEVDNAEAAAAIHSAR